MSLVLSVYLFFIRYVCFALCRLMQVPKPWYRSYLSAKAAMQQDLFGTNPTMAAVLDLWHKTFG